MTTIRILTETGPKFIDEDEWERLDTDPNKIVFRNGRYGFNCFGHCVEGESTAVHYGIGEDVLLIFTAESPNGRWSYSAHYHLCGLIGQYSLGFCWDKNYGWRDEPTAVTAALKFMRSRIEDYLSEEDVYCGISAVEKRGRLNPVLEFIEKKLKFWDPVLHQLRSN